MQIDFYSLNTDSKTQLIEFTKRLVRQIYYKNLSIFIISDSVADLHKIDEELWNMEESDFIAHDLANKTKDNSSNLTNSKMIELGLYEEISAKDVAINLSTKSLIDKADNFNRIVEISIKEEEYLQAKREIWQTYKKANFTLKHHSLS